MVSAIFVGHSVRSVWAVVCRGGIFRTVLVCCDGVGSRAYVGARMFGVYVYWGLFGGPAPPLRALCVMKAGCGVWNVQGKLLGSGWEECERRYFGKWTYVGVVLANCIWG